MVTRSKSPLRPLPSMTTPQGDFYIAGDVLPLPEVIEKDSDSVWALWSDAVQGTPERDDETQPATLLMGLPDLPKDRDR